LTCASPASLEPWLRGTHTEVDAVRRAVIHALELVEEDINKWCGGLSDEELNATPPGLPSVAFHIRHIARSMDRLLSYAEGQQLDGTQIAAMKSELEPGAMKSELFAEFAAAIADAKSRVLKFSSDDFNNERGVGKKMLPTTVGGLLVHVADHTNRHAGQAVTTAKVIVAMRQSE
jgi:uncharacterized damage-inducible protein DinB